MQPESQRSSQQQRGHALTTKPPLFMAHRNIRMVDPTGDLTINTMVKSPNIILQNRIQALGNCQYSLVYPTSLNILLMRVTQNAYKHLIGKPQG
jgi:hypothetical protein